MTSQKKDTDGVNIVLRHTSMQRGEVLGILVAGCWRLQGVPPVSATKEPDEGIRHSYFGCLRERTLHGTRPGNTRIQPNCPDILSREDRPVTSHGVWPAGSWRILGEFRAIRRIAAPLSLLVSRIGTAVAFLTHRARPRHERWTTGRQVRQPIRSQHTQDHDKGGKSNVWTSMATDGCGTNRLESSAERDGPHVGAICGEPAAGLWASACSRH